MDRFVSLFLRIANANPASICQITLVTFENGAIADEWSTHIDPEVSFLPLAVKVHSITPEKVRGFPNFKTLYPELQKRLENQTVVTYNLFDHFRLQRAAEKYHLRPLEYVHLDGSKAIRAGYLQNSEPDTLAPEISEYMDLPLKQLDGLRIARRVGQLVNRASQETGISVSQWANDPQFQSDPSRPLKGRSFYIRTENREGHLFGQTVTFAGDYVIPRHMLASLASQRGCNIAPYVDPNCTLLVVGYIDKGNPSYFDDEVQVTKAKQLARSKHTIRILTEQEFFDLLEPAEQAVL